jgi:hypothetical protein
MGNFSRDTFDALKHYVGVRLQQGVPIVDADWNELEDIRRYELRTFLRWFVGNGVPEGNNGFAVFAVKAANDFGIRGGDGTAMGAGRCLVDGWEVVNESDLQFTEQALFDNAELAAEWGVEPVQPLTTPESDRDDLVYLDVWEREVDSTEDPEHLVNPAIGVETAVRLKREWAVRVVQGETTLPPAPAGHAFYALATLERTDGEPSVPDSAMTDQRQTRLTLAAHLMQDNPHQITAEHVGAPISMGGVSNPGGDIDLASDNTITLDPDAASKRITIGENHSARTNNPHQVTAEQVGALPAELRRRTGVDWLVVPIGTDTQLRVMGAIPGNQSLAHFRNEHEDARRAIFARVDGPTDRGARNAAVIGQSRQDDVHGVYAVAPSETFSLFVRGTARVTEGVDPYLIDTAINASGQVLRTGDVIRLKGSPVRRFRGEKNKMPVPEVTLADKENDTTVIGIVDREAIPDADEPDHRTDRQDPTSIPDGGEVFMVTLGCYAHCKVDATEAPIEVGDLLTSSSNPGHARKATEPRIGSIIGKALEPMNGGTGYIAVFVNIQ